MNQPSIQTTFPQGRYTVVVAHQLVLGPVRPGERDIVLQSEIGERNTQSSVTIRSDDFYRAVLLHWAANEYELDNFAVLFAEQTHTPFVGVRGFSASVNLQSGAIISLSEDRINRFWEFKYVDGFVLELGELNCFLYSPSGRQVDAAVVDPPYEYEVLEKGIRFRSPVYGEQWLHYP